MNNNNNTNNNNNSNNDSTINYNIGDNNNLNYRKGNTNKRVTSNKNDNRTRITVNAIASVNLGGVIVVIGITRNIINIMETMPSETEAKVDLIMTYMLGV